MLISIHFPCADARGFVDGAGGRLSMPRWINPDPETEFVRNFGAIRVRARGGAAMGGEDRTCAAFWALRFRNWPTRKHYGAFRGFYADGEAIAKFDVGVAIEPSGTSLDAIHTIERIHAQLAVVPTVRSEPTALAALGPYLAKAYLLASTSTQRSNDVQAWWIRSGAPVTIVQYNRRDGLVFPESMSSLVTEWSQGSVKLAHWWQPFEGKLRRVWFLGYEEGPDYPLARQLRIDLVRLHCERESLRIILKHVANGKLQPEPHSAGSDRLQRYLNDAIRRVTKLVRERRDVVASDASRLIELAAADVLDDDTESLITDVDAQLKKLDVRPNILQKTRAYLAESESLRAMPRDQRSVLEAFPYPFQTADGQELLRIMSSLYPNERVAIALVEQHGISPGDVTPGLPAKQLWHELLAKLVIAGTLRSVLEAARGFTGNAMVRTFLDIQLMPSSTRE
jgi:hypothetical protein